MEKQADKIAIKEQLLTFKAGGVRQQIIIHDGEMDPTTYAFFERFLRPLEPKNGHKPLEESDQKSRRIVYDNRGVDHQRYPLASLLDGSLSPYISTSLIHKLARKGILTPQQLAQTTSEELYGLWRDPGSKSLAIAQNLREKAIKSLEDS